MKKGSKFLVGALVAVLVSIGGTSTVVAQAAQEAERPPSREVTAKFSVTGRQDGPHKVTVEVEPWKVVLDVGQGFHVKCSLSVDGGTFQTKPCQVLLPIDDFGLAYDRNIDFQEGRYKTIPGTAAAPPTTRGLRQDAERRPYAYQIKMPYPIQAIEKVLIDPEYERRSGN